MDEFIKYVKENYDIDLAFIEENPEDTFRNLLFSISPCENCSNNHKNGGSGICHCTLATPVIY